MPQLSKNHWICGGIVAVILIALGAGLGVHFSTTGDDSGPLRCLVCSGSRNLCENGDNGVSETCPVDTVACIISTASDKIQRQCGPVNSLTAPFKMNECVLVSSRGEEKSVCACDTGNDCNKDPIQ